MYLHIIDRSDLDEIVQVGSKGRVSRLELLRDFPIVRTDIVLINGTVSKREYSLHVTDTGFAGDLWILDVLSDQQFCKVQAIAHKMRTNVKTHPEAEALLVNLYRVSEHSVLPFGDR